MYHIYNDVEICHFRRVVRLGVETTQFKIKTFIKGLYIVFRPYSKDRKISKCKYCICLCSKVKMYNENDGMI